MNGTKSAGTSVEVSPNSSHVMLPGHHIRHPYHHACLIPGFNYVVLNQHTGLLTKLGASIHVCELHHKSNNVSYNCTRLIGRLGTAALAQQACLSKLHPASVHVCPSCTRRAVQPSLSQGQQTSLSLYLFDYVAQDQHTCLKPIIFSVTASRG